MVCLDGYLPYDIVKKENGPLHSCYSSPSPSGQCSTISTTRIALITHDNLSAENLDQFKWMALRHLVAKCTTLNKKKDCTSTELAKHT